MGRARTGNQQEVTNAAHVEARRARVAALAAEKMSERGIVAFLERGGMLNPETGRGYSKATVHDDLVAIRAEWRTMRRRETEEWIAEELAGLNHVEALAYESGRLDVVIRAKEQRAKLLGLNAPTKTELTGKDGENLEFNFSYVPPRTEELA